MIDLNFPVFATKDSLPFVYVAKNIKELTRASQDILDDKYFNNLILIDSKGKKFFVKKAFKVRTRFPFGISLVVKGKQIVVDFEFSEEVAEITLDSFKKTVIEKVNLKKSFWCQPGVRLRSLNMKLKHVIVLNALPNLFNRL